MNSASKSHVVWISSILPDKTLDAATWLDTTDHLRKLGWQVTLIGEGPETLRAVRGIDVHCFPRPKVYLLGRLIYHLYIIAYLLRGWSQIDVILFDQISAVWILPLRWLRGLIALGQGGHRPLFVMDTRDLADLATTNWRLRLRLWFFHNVVFGLAHRWTDGETAITTRLADLVGVPAEQRLGYWPSGVNPATFTVAQTSRRWPQGDESVRLIYIGRLLSKRNLLPLGRAVAAANAQGAKFVLSLYGDGPGRTELAHFAATSKGAVELMPPVNHEAIPALLGQAHIGVTSLPTQDDRKYQASSPVKLFEYLAAGMPLLSTRNVCHTEVVGDGNYAFWADEPTEAELLAALQSAWQQRHQLATLGEEAAKDAADWSWAAAARKLSDALERALHRSHNVTMSLKYSP